MEAEKLKDLICRELDEKSATDITVLDVAHMTVIADYFVICTAKSNAHVRALAEHLEEKIEEAGERILRTDGVKDGKWAVLDTGGVIVHIFNDDTRMFYCLEKLWSDGNNLNKFPAE